MEIGEVGKFFEELLHMKEEDPDLVREFMQEVGTL